MSERTNVQKVTLQVVTADDNPLAHGDADPEDNDAGLPPQSDYGTRTSQPKAPLSRKPGSGAPLAEISRRTGGNDKGKGPELEDDVVSSEAVELENPKKWPSSMAKRVEEERAAGMGDLEEARKAFRQSQK